MFRKTLLLSRLKVLKNVVVSHNIDYDPTAFMRKGIETLEKYKFYILLLEEYDPTAFMRKGIFNLLNFIEHFFRLLFAF